MHILKTSFLAILLCGTGISTHAISMRLFYTAHAVANIIAEAGLPKIKALLQEKLSKSYDTSAVASLEPGAPMTTFERIASAVGNLDAVGNFIKVKLVVPAVILFIWYKMPQLINSHIFGINSAGLVNSVMSFGIRMLFTNLHPNPWISCGLAAVGGIASEFILGNYAKLLPTPKSV